MKPLPLVLAASLAANVALVAVVLCVKPAFLGFPPSTIASAPSGRSAAAGGGVTGDAAGAGGLSWGALQKEDLKTLAQRLRAAGFPPSIVRAIIAAKIRDAHSARRKALLAKPDDTPYWKRTTYGYDPKMMAELREINREERSLLREVLGPDAEDSDDRKAYQRRQYGDLSPDKLEQMGDILSDYTDLRAEIYSKANNFLLPEDREQLALLDKEQRADLSALLTPEELENYELRSSQTATFLRSYASIFGASEDEFRSLYRSLRAAEDKYGPVSSSAMTTEKLAQYAADVLESQKGTLSGERYALLQQALDAKYQLANRLVARLELPATAAVAVVSTQEETLKKAAAIRRNAELSNEQKAAELSALAATAEASLTATLTARGYDAYKVYAGWLTQMKPKTTAK